MINTQKVKNTYLLLAFVQNAVDTCGKSNTDEIFPQETPKSGKKIKYIHISQVVSAIDKHELRTVEICLLSFQSHERIG